MSFIRRTSAWALPSLLNATVKCRCSDVAYLLKYGMRSRAHKQYMEFSSIYDYTKLYKRVLPNAKDSWEA